MNVGVQHMQQRLRATVIVETPEGILLTRMRRGRWMLPGGGVEPGEQPISAAIRELQEDDLPGFFGPMISRKMAPNPRGAHEKEPIH